ncbi:hAT family dimerization protein [Ceratobasidium sp. AG-Ba]|nr:hAT family dimerization protein [Ceratobasidium sp. AG-Ba]
MRGKHPLIWSAASEADAKALGKALAKRASEEDLSGKVRPSEQADTGFNIDEFYRLLCRWIVTSSQPFSEVENDEFQELLTYLRPALEGHILKAEAIRNRIFHHAELHRCSTRQYLSSLPGLMAISCDAWTSSNRIAFLAITASWITHDWRLEETLLDFVELRGAHDGQNMASAVSSALSELGIEEKVVALVSDIASNNGTLVRHLSTSLKKSSPKSRWDRDKAHIRCLSHVIHLAVMSLLRGLKAVPPSTDIRDFDPSDQHLTPEDAEAFAVEVSDETNNNESNITVDSVTGILSAIEKIRSISKLVRSSPQRMELFKATAKGIEDYHEQKAIENHQKYTRKTIKNLILDVATRWNSVFFMLERALEFSEATDALTSHPKVTLYRCYALSKDDWASVAQVCSWLRFFRSASTMMAAERYPTLSFSLRIYFVLITYVSKLENEAAAQESPTLCAGVRACKDKLLEFFDQSTYDSEYYYFATILDPRFKDSLFKSRTSWTSELFSEEWVDDCAASLQDIGDSYYNDTEQNTHSDPVNNFQPDDFDVTDDFSRAWQAQIPSRTLHASISNPISSELAVYLKEGLTKMAPLAWWRLNAHRFPHLAAMARDFLCIPGTSVAVERVFSYGRDLIGVRRASLSAETIRMLMTYRAGIMLEKCLTSGAEARETAAV